jgi:hypothetical protein
VVVSVTTNPTGASEESWNAVDVGSVSMLSSPVDACWIMLVSGSDSALFVFCSSG